MDKDSKNLSEEEYLKRHLMEVDGNSDNKLHNRLNQRQAPIKVEVDNSTVDSLKYFTSDIKEFPCGVFYPAGTQIQIRPAEVKEIQAYSMIDDNNYYDIVNKMNDMLLSCVRIKYTDGRIGSYIELRDPDRFYLIFLIRGLTFQQGNSLVTKSTCSCGEENQIDLKRENFRNFEMPEKLRKYYDATNKCFTFRTIDGGIYHLAPPTIGLQKAFTDYIVKENSENKKPNLSFLKIIPFVLFNKTIITQEEIQDKLEEYQNKMSNESFQFLNAAVEKLSFGIEKVVKNCTSCGTEVHSSMIFPNGPSSLFIIHDAFSRYISE